MYTHEDVLMQQVKIDVKNQTEKIVSTLLVWRSSITTLTYFFI